MEYARDLVAAKGGKVVLVNVQPAPAVTDARRIAERALGPAKAVLYAAGVAWTAEVEFGRRAQAILRCAKRERCSHMPKAVPVPVWNRYSPPLAT